MKMAESASRLRPRRLAGLLSRNFVDVAQGWRKKHMFVLTSAYQQCRSRLRQDDLGVTLWGYLCAVLFLIAMTISLLGCAGAPFAPRLEGTMMGGAASSASSSETG